MLKPEVFHLPIHPGWLAGMLLLVATGLYARPADWYLWQSKLDAKTLCSQTSPGDGWEKFSGPFVDGRCEVLRK